MEFSRDSDDDEIREAAQRFAERELGEEAPFSRDRWRTCAAFGIQRSALPAEFGGLENDLKTVMAMMEGLGYGCRDRGLLFGLNAQMWSVQHPIVHFGSGEQKRKYLAALGEGELIGAHGMTEPDSGSDAFSLRTRAVKVDGGYVLNGSKTLITNAPVADVFVVFATVDPERGHWGVTAFLIERDAAGLTVGSAMEKMGLRSSPLGELSLSDCFVPESARLGAEGGGAAIFASSMEWERGAILSGQVGSMARQLDECVQYVKQRRQFRTEIGKFPPVRDRIANMKLRLEMSRLILLKMAWLKSVNKTADMEAAIAKLYLSEAFVESSLDAMRVHGGYGYLAEYQRESELRDAIGGLFYSGTSDMQRVLIASLLGA